MLTQFLPQVPKRVNSWFKIIDSKVGKFIYISRQDDTNCLFFLNRLLEDLLVYSSSIYV